MQVPPSPQLELARARIGSVLRGKWRLDSLLGLGGMAAVYAATHRNGKRGAVKLLHVELAHNADIRERFLREGYVSNKIEHPGAVSVLDDDVTEDGAVFVVMELLQGETLESRAKRQGGTLPLSEVVRFADALLDILVVAHQAGVVHRDLKPDNLFLTRDGQLKVLDFGIARLREAQDTSSATRTGTSMGTPSFMPPEQALGNWSQVDARTDLWAVGATMFALATGRMVHEADTLNKLLLAAMTRPASPIRSIADSIPASVAEVIDRALAFDQSQRWPDARTMQLALRQALLLAAAPAQVPVAPATAGPGLPVVSQAPTPPTQVSAGVSAPPQFISPSTGPALVQVASLGTTAPVSSDPSAGQTKAAARRRMLVAAIASSAGLALIAALAVGMARRASSSSVAAQVNPSSEAAPPPSSAATVEPPDDALAAPAASHAELDAAASSVPTGLASAGPPADTPPSKLKPPGTKTTGGAGGRSGGPSKPPSKDFNTW
ncbi:MAG: protein kinase [Deltaproteobacteria bacterium]|nr:protein kinase [Deltaproteobacteria bacterium]